MDGVKAISTRRLIALVYLGLMVLPFVALGLLGFETIDAWVRTGMCPAGPMDRPAAPCGLGQLIFIVFLGGWAAFLVVPLLGFWWINVTVAMLFLRRHLNRRQLELRHLNRRQPNAAR